MQNIKIFASHYINNAKLRTKSNPFESLAFLMALIKKQFVFKAYGGVGLRKRQRPHANRSGGQFKIRAFFCVFLNSFSDYLQIRFFK